MQELTITGATMLSDHPGRGSATTDGPSVIPTAGAHSCETTTASPHLVVSSLVSSSLHGQSHSCCGPAPIMHRPILALRKPAVELVRDASNYDVYQLLLQVIRMGQYELFLELMEAWRNFFSSSSNEGMTIDQIVHAYDTSGHTLTHWAAKRVDDVRIIQYLLQNVTFDTLSHRQYVWNADHRELEPLMLPQSSPPTDDNSKDHLETSSQVDSYPTPIHRPTFDETRMTPLHWACTQEQGLSLIKILLDYGGVPLLELRDGTGCTPCLIAAQHGRVETVAYLIQRGANIYAVDTARDSAIHWAAYKGSEAVLGLVSFYSTHQQFYTPDAYGQTPLHLASLRGHVSVVRYILHQLLQPPPSQANSAGAHQGKSPSTTQRMATIRAVRELLALQDQNGRTPYDLAVHKNKPAVAAVLKAQAIALQRMSNPSWQWQQYISWATIRQICQLRTWKVWLGLPEVDDVDESPRFAFYYVIAHLVGHFLFTFTVFIPLHNITNGVLWDYMFMLTINLCLIGLSAYTLYQCHTTNPGRLDAAYDRIQIWRRLYEQTLETLAAADERRAQIAAAVQLCHTCHIARPPRSKHDRFSRACILQFDHHCPFVGTTIGLYNYKWFFAFILAVSIYFINFLILLIVHYRRTTIHANSYFILLLGLYMGLHILFSGGMVIYHAQLVFANLTTNEHLNMNRYDYLWRITSSHGAIPHRTFYNPWNKGCWNNMYDRFVEPGDRSYLLPTMDTLELRSSSIELHQPLISHAETV